MTMIKLKSIHTCLPFGRKVLQLIEKEGSHKNFNNENWFISSKKIDDVIFVEEETYWKGHTVVVSTVNVFQNKSLLKKCLTVDTVIRDVLYTNFCVSGISERQISCMCVLEKQSLSVFAESGETYYITLPFNVKKMWAIDKGLCVERDMTSLDADFERRNMPTMFSLLHPLDDFKPFVFRSADVKKPLYSLLTTKNIVSAIAEHCLVITFDSVHNQLAIWHTRAATPQDTPDAIHCIFPEISNQSLNYTLRDHGRFSCTPTNKRRSCPLLSQRKASMNSPFLKNNSPVNTFRMPAHPNQAAYQTTEHLPSVKSQLHSPALFRMSCDESILEGDIEPLPPDLCFEQVWQDFANLTRRTSNKKPGTVFVTNDFSGNVYLGHFLESSNSLRLIKKTEKNFETVAKVECLSAAACQILPVYVVIDLSYKLQLYSGVQKIGCIDLPATLTKDILHHEVTISSASADNFHLCVGDTVYRLQIPSSPHHFKKVAPCIKAQRQTLSNHEYNLMHGKYFLIESSPRYWEDFKMTTCKLLGLPTLIFKENEMPSSPQAKKPKQSDQYNKDWDYLLANNKNVLWSAKRKCQTSKRKETVEIKLQKNATLCRSLKSVFLNWHCLYEKVKLNAFEFLFTEQFGQFLYTLSRVLGLQTYKQAYVNDFPFLENNTQAVYKVSSEQLLDIKHVPLNFAATFGDTMKKLRFTKSDAKQLLSIDSRADHLMDVFIKFLGKENDSREFVDLLPVGYKLPMKEMTHSQCKEGQPLRSQKNTFVVNNIISRHSDADGMGFDEEILLFRFNRDLRVNEVKLLLDSSKPAKICITQATSMSDHSFAKEEENKLLIICNRTMALPVARGMFTMGTSNPALSEPIAIPTLDLSGISSTNNKCVQLKENATSYLYWPSFHNGVSAGLKVATSVSEINSTWILFNKLNYDMTSEHSGFLFALGLSGHLSVLSNLHIHDYLIKRNELNAIALLLGISATKIGSQDPHIYKLICLHLDFLLPSTALEISITECSQVAAIVSLGFLFFKSRNLYLVKLLLAKIMHVADQSCHARESLALASGLALGMMVIAQGENSTNIDVTNALHRCIYGGYKSNQMLTSLPNYQRSQDRDTINTDITFPAAVVALSLMYLQSNNRSVANWLKVTNFEKVMKSIKPDHLLLQLMAYNLIMWDELVPLDVWLKEHIPPCTISDKGVLTSESNLALHYIASIMAGCFLALGIKFAGSHNIAAFKLMIPWLKSMKASLELPEVNEVGGKASLEQAMDTTLIALSLLMAGSGNKTLLRFARQLHKRCTSDVTYGNHMATHMSIGFLFLGAGVYSLKTDHLSIACLLCAVYPKWPTSAKDNKHHLQALRHLYFLASENRLLVPRDMHSNSICSAPVNFTYKETEFYSETSVKVLAPCLIPEFKYLKKIEVTRPRYAPLVIDVHSSTLDDIREVFIKRKSKYYSCVGNGQEKKSYFIEALKFESGKSNLLNALHMSACLVRFEKLFCTANNVEPILVKQVERYSDMLRECVATDNAGLLEDLLILDKIVTEARNGRKCYIHTSQLKLLFTFYENNFLKPKNTLLNEMHLMKISILLEMPLKR